MSSESKPSKSALICPESTIESANRRQFIRKAALTAAAVGVGSTVVSNAVMKRSAIPESSASDGCPVIIGECNFAEQATGITVCTGGTTSCYAWKVFNKAKCGSGIFACGLRTGVFAQTTAAACCLPAVKGYAKGGCSHSIGVCGQSNSPNGIGVRGFNVGGGVALEGLAGNAKSIPIVATGDKCQSVNLQNWQVGSTIKSVVNKNGFFGINNSSPDSPLTVNSSPCSAHLDCYVVGAAIHGISTGIDVAIWGDACSPSGIGVQGYAKSKCGCGIGVAGRAAACEGVGVYGFATASKGATRGVWGASVSPGGIGVLGQAYVSGGVGVQGFSCSPCGVPIVALGGFCQRNNLQEWQILVCEGKPGEVKSVVNKNGFFGINNSSPSKPLTVCGAVEFSQTSACGTLIASNAGSGKAISASSSSCTSPAICGTNTHYIGIQGRGGTYGVYGSGLFGVYGTSFAQCAYGVQGVAGAPCTVPLIAIGALKQNYNITEFAKMVCCSGTKKTDVLSVVNKCGWLGLGATSAPTTLHVGGSVSAKVANTGSSNYCMGASDYAVFACSPVTVALPKAGTAKGMMVFVKNTSSGSVTVTVAKCSGDCIEGNTAPKTLTKQWDGLHLISNGTHRWVVLGSSIGDAFVS